MVRVHNEHTLIRDEIGNLSHGFAENDCLTCIVSTDTVIRFHFGLDARLGYGVNENGQKSPVIFFPKYTNDKLDHGKYFVSILVEKEYNPVQKTNKSVGIDLGLKDFLIISDGTKTKNHRFFKKYQKLLKINQKHLSRKEKDSKKKEQQRLKVTKIHEKISNSRLNLIHQTTSYLIKNYDIICLEDLNIKGMSHRCKSKQDENGKYLPNGQSAKSGLNKSILDVAWGKFVETLEYKAEWNDKKVVKISRWYPSSKTCNCCGWINQDLKLKNRTWTCQKCNTVLDRDINASKNILKEGLKIISDGTSDYGHGDQIRLDLSSIVYEVSKEMEQYVPETTTSLV